jgi:hypothetical protein
MTKEGVGIDGSRGSMGDRQARRRDRWARCAGRRSAVSVRPNASTSGRPGCLALTVRRGPTVGEALQAADRNAGRGGPVL